MSTAVGTTGDELGQPVDTTTGPAAQTTVVTGQAEFDALAAAWEDLWRRTPDATPFQSHAWCSAWARAYVPGGQLAVAVVRDGDRLVAAAPLYRSSRGLVRALAPLGGPLNDSTVVLLDPHVPDAAARLIRALLDVPGWRVVDLPDVRPGSRTQEWSRAWPGRSRRTPSWLTLELPVLPQADLLGRLPARTAGTLRRKIRKIDKLGVERIELPATAVDTAVDELLRLHEAQWAGRQGNPEHLTARFRSFLVEAVSAMIDRGQAVLVEYRLEGRVVASEIDLVGHRQLAYYLAGVDPALRARIDTAVLLVTGAMGLAERLGLPEYSFLRGDEDYKLRWRPERVTAERVVLARPGLLGSGGYLLASAAASAAMALARRMPSGRARDLARSVAHRVRVIRARR